MVCVSLDIVDRYLGCSRPLATGNDTSINILGNIFWWTNILSSLAYVPKNGSAEPYHSTTKKCSKTHAALFPFYREVQ